MIDAHIVVKITVTDVVVVLNLTQSLLVETIQFYYNLEISKAFPNFILVY